MKYTEVLQIIEDRLGDNYNDNDDEVLESILNEVINQASYISNRDITTTSNNDIADPNLLILSHEIINASIIAYQTRGVESVKSQSELGQSNTFVDYTEKLRNDIIKNGKRIIA